MPPALRGLLAVLGRVLLCAIFFMAAVGNKIPNFSKVAGFMKFKGMPAPELLLVGAIVFLIVGSLSVIVGYKAQLGATLLLLFLIPATYFFHDFWNVDVRKVNADGAKAIVTAAKADTQDELDNVDKDKLKERQDRMGQFMKNLALMGAMLFIIANGSGPMSLDSKPSP